MLGNSPPLYMCVSMCASLQAMVACGSNGFLNSHFFHVKAKLGVGFLLGFQEEESLLCHQESRVLSAID